MKRLVEDTTVYKPVIMSAIGKGDSEPKTNIIFIILENNKMLKRKERNWKLENLCIE